MTTATFDPGEVREHLDRANALGLEPVSRPKRAGVPRVEDILSCVYEAARDRFHVVYADLSSADLDREELDGVRDRRVVAWEVDEFRRGVEVVLEDGETTSFSAEYPRYLRDEEYRRQVDARRGSGGGDLGLRIAARIRAERERLGWPVAELARRAGMAAPNLHRVESGKHVPSVPTVSRLAVALEVPLDRLLKANTTP